MAYSKHPSSAEINDDLALLERSDDNSHNWRLQSVVGPINIAIEPSFYEVYYQGEYKTF